jgi:baculoviral IAP repeat-containing protein 7/8
MYSHFEFCTQSPKKIDEIIHMEDVSNQSLSKRCASFINRIKQQKENRPQLTLTTNPVDSQNKVLPTKRHTLQELASIPIARLQSYSNWPHFSPSREVMAANGWYYCNVADRTLCIYCNIICHNWADTDDPYEVHVRRAPDCPFILSIPCSSKDPLAVANHSLNGSFQPHHKSMCEVTRRQETFNTKAWTQTSPTIEDLAQAGFFYFGTENSVTCFYCNGSLHKWGPNDSPKIEHGRWFPDCLYAKHLCGNRLHAKIQSRKKQLLVEKNSFDKETLIRLVNARLDLPIVQRLRQQHKLSIIKRCIESQLKNHQDDFASESDLIMACFILQKQIDIIQGKPENLITPSEGQISINSPEMSNRKFEECLICLTEERQLACMPCGHLTACVSCSYALRSCPICREKIQSFVRIYC